MQAGRRGGIVTPEEKEIVIDEIDQMIEIARIRYERGTEPYEHITACLGDRQIEIKRGEWDEKD